MKVLLDGFWWRSGPPSGRLVAQSIIREWLRQWPQDQLAVAVPHGDVEHVRADLGGSAALVPLRMKPHGLAVALELPVVARSMHADAVLTHNFAPVAGPSAVFLHDVLFRTNPSWFTRSELAYFALMAPLAKRADVVLTSSVAEAHRIHREVGVLPIAVGLGVADSILDSPGVPPPGLTEDTPFVLSVGRLNIRKNLARTIEAAVASHSITPARPLLVVGAAQGKTGETSGVVDRAIEDGTVLFLGHVDDGELAWLYRHAELFVFLSLDEGFGLPPIEARAVGTPVLVSDIPVLRETLGSDATYADPTDVAAITAAMDACLLRQAPRTAGPSASSYRWSKTVAAIREALVASAGGSR